MAIFAAQPSQHFTMHPVDFINAVQLACRAPTSHLAGCGDRCICGAHLDAYGDHIMSCNLFLFLRTTGHDLVQEEVAKMSRYAGHALSWDSKKAKARSVGYSPHHIPDLTLLHGAPDKSHVLIDIVCPSVVHVAAAAAFPLIAADAAEGSKHEMFGDVRPHKVLPFAVEDGGALGREAKTFFHTCKAACANQLRGADYERQTGTARGYSNFFFQSISAANYRGLSHTLMIAGDTIRASHL